jgi:hypothetical protein
LTKARWELSQPEVSLISIPICIITRWPAEKLWSKCMARLRYSSTMSIPMTIQVVRNNRFHPRRGDCWQLWADGGQTGSWKSGSPTKIVVWYPTTGARRRQSSGRVRTPTFSVKGGFSWSSLRLRRKTERLGQGSPSLRSPWRRWRSVVDGISLSPNRSRSSRRSCELPSPRCFLMTR